ncbi:hypothetical protein [Deinococcus alpinitundrae]|uniref:hypothetical protein n=1 Tax=Deinococcus alpinitundrae TaxID=468913 RepID=UPI001ED922C2|nr:hypothetical protein [Deinococcus alpinitundrae]
MIFKGGGGPADDVHRHAAAALDPLVAVLGEVVVNFDVSPVPFGDRAPGSQR